MTDVKNKIVKTGQAARAKYQAKSDKFHRNVRRAGAIATTTIALGTIYRLASVNIKKSTTENKITSDIHVQQAAMFKNAINPSGSSWFKDWDGTKEQLIYNLAKQVTDFKKVKNAYKRLYSSFFSNADLLKDLQKDLDDNEFAKFLNIIKGNDDGFIPSDKEYQDINLKSKRIIAKYDTRIVAVNKDKTGTITVKKLKRNEIPGKTLTLGIILTSDILTVDAVDYHRIIVQTIEGNNYSALVQKSNIQLISKEEATAKLNAGTATLVKISDSDFE